MPFLIFIVAAFVFWIHAERNLNFSKRVIGGIVFWGSCLLLLHYAHGERSNYERAYVARAFANVATDANAERKDKFLKLAESYGKRTISGADLLLESERILSPADTNQAEQTGRGDGDKPPN
jgi:hypothetical protein